MSVKSEIAKVKENLIKSRKAILARGGEIATDAGLKDLPSAILNIPPDFALSFIEDDGVAYQKTAPENSLPYAQIKKIGGMTYKSKNRFDANKAIKSNGSFTVSNGEIVWTPVGDGDFFAFGYWLDCEPNTNYTVALSSASIRAVYIYTDTFYGNIIFYDFLTGGELTFNSGEHKRLLLAFYSLGSNRIGTSETISEIVIEKGTTAVYEPFFEGLRNAAVEEVKSEGADGTLDTFAISQAVQSIGGYGIGVNADCYNYADFNARTFVKKVGGVDLGTLDFSVHSSNENRIVFTARIENIKNHDNAATPATILADGYRTVSQDQTWVPGDIAQSSIEDAYKYIRVVEKADVTLEEFKSLVNGRMLYYALETPEVTDISSILQSDNFIKVEGGGTLTFENEHGYAVPSTVKYVLGVG